MSSILYPAKLQLKLDKDYFMPDIAKQISLDISQPIMAFTQNFEGTDAICYLKVGKNSKDLFKELRESSYFWVYTSVIISDTKAKFHSMWKGNNAGDQEVSIFNIDNNELRKFLDLCPHLLIFQYVDYALDKWHDKTYRKNHDDGSHPVASITKEQREALDAYLEGI